MGCTRLDSARAIAIKCTAFVRVSTEPRMVTMRCGTLGAGFVISKCAPLSALICFAVDPALPMMAPQSFVSTIKRIGKRMTALLSEFASGTDRGTPATSLARFVTGLPSGTSSRTCLTPELSCCTGVGEASTATSMLLGCSPTFMLLNREKVQTRRRAWRVLSTCLGKKLLQAVCIETIACVFSWHPRHGLIVWPSSWFVPL